MTMSLLDPTKTAWLVPLNGPPLEPIQLHGGGSIFNLGRHEQCEIRLPPDADRVSRMHARLRLDAEHWRLADLGSRWGTYVNGVRLEPSHEVPLQEGDLVRISPWTFSFNTMDPGGRGVDSVNDLAQMQTIVHPVSHQQTGALAEDMLALLLESAAGIHAAVDEPALARMVVDAALRGTGLTHGAWLRMVDGAGRVEVAAQRWLTDVTGGAVFSRSLISAASSGQVVELSAATAANTSESIVRSHITSAICVPLMLGPIVAAYLYLDAREGAGGTRPMRSGASAFCLALGRMAGLALANLKRLDIEKRHAVIQAEISAGAEAQRWILPRRSASYGPFSYVGESRPGQMMGGDFFDVIPLSAGRLAVALGDVTGKGVAASVLMTATQGFLHAALREHGDVARAVSDLNAFINPRRPESKFVTLWVGVWDDAARTLSYVDAGHGWALMASPDGTIRRLSGTEGYPIGIIEDAKYKSAVVPLPPGGRALIVSDGLVEQFGMDATGERIQFEIHSVERFLLDRFAPAASADAGAAGASDPADDVEGLFAAVIAHAGTSQLTDDATAVLVKWP